MDSYTQNYTGIHQKEQDMPEEKLINGISRAQATAIALKSEGLTHKEISEKLLIPLDTIKSWFRRGTLTYGAYLRYSKDVIGQIGMDSLHRLRLQTEKDTNTIIELMGEKYSPAIRLSASKYVLDKDLPLSLKEKEERADFHNRFENMLEVIGVSPESMAQEGEAGDQARERFDRHMGLLDEAESWN